MLPTVTDDAVPPKPSVPGPEMVAVNATAAYGAAAKGNTFLNYAGVKADLIEYVADRNPAKQGKWMPGSRIPIVDEAHLQASKPDFVVILPWNIQDEVADQLAYIRQWGAKFVVVQPDFRIW